MSHLAVQEPLTQEKEIVQEPPALVQEPPTTVPETSKAPPEARHSSAFSHTLKHRTTASPYNMPIPKSHTATTAPATSLEQQICKYSEYQKSNPYPPSFYTGTTPAIVNLKQEPAYNFTESHPQHTTLEVEKLQKSDAKILSEVEAADRLFAMFDHSHPEIKDKSSAPVEEHQPETFPRPPITLFPGAEVITKVFGARGIVTESRLAKYLVRILSSGTEVEVKCEDVIPVMPATNDRVIIICGHYVGQTGVLLGSKTAYGELFGVVRFDSGVFDSSITFQQICKFSK